MKEVFDSLIQIIENSNGIREKMEADVKKYYETHQPLFQQAQERFMNQIQESVKNFTMTDLGKMVENMVLSLKSMMGEDNFNKIIRFQRQYPFLNPLLEKILPKNP